MKEAETKQKELLEDLYGTGKHPSEWQSLSTVALHFGVTTSKLRQWFREYRVKERTSSDNLRRAQWELHLKDHPLAYKNLEDWLRVALLRHGFYEGSDFIRNAEVAPGVFVDFYFVGHGKAVELDYRWSETFPRKRLPGARSVRSLNARHRALSAVGVSPEYIQYKNPDSAWSEVADFLRRNRIVTSGR